MSADQPVQAGRRAFLGAGAAVLAGLAAPAWALQDAPEADTALGGTVRSNVSAFRALDWQDYFANTRNGVILCDTKSRALHFWSEDQTIYRLYPTSVPLTDDLTRLGKTEVVQKVENPTWRPTPSMLKRNPEWPAVVEGGAPDNPLGVRALYLSWPAYRIHGTHDTRKIGRRSSSGCIGLYNEHILELFGLAQVGTQVLLI
ncbi:MAG: L,D-transpeptidase [Rhodobacter sp.]|nr:L,D-transpeptidase [Rhodobacter sp.]MCA3457115.1 L,D-transpeptidase [Rhodobacter sp.]MCA3460873.1 L,D-transpeptidase [Rhodobacter sp.]MCA3462837.1 L,D-transpeptidase [Rhodobacter sp.]MCA3466403.1 L,D-transpeptidase [Rhodobacter sp.]